MTKHLRKFRPSDKEPAKKIRIEASSQDIDGEQSSKPICFTAPPAIRNKLTWHAPSATWQLHLIKPPVPLADYLTRHNLTLAMADEGNPYDYEKERTQLYITAVKVWNALDTSNRRRIRLPANMDEDAN